MSEANNSKAARADSEKLERSLAWFRLANAGNYPDKRTWFYPFKGRFLARYGRLVAYAHQKIIHECWSCGGAGQMKNLSYCYSCLGSGVYRATGHWLECWDVGSLRFHRPVEFFRPPAGHGLPEEQIEGRIKHAAVPEKAARRAFQRLLLRHEPVTFYAYVVARLRSRCLGYRLALAWRVIRLRNKLDLFPAVKLPPDDVPF